MMRGTARALSWLLPRRRWAIALIAGVAGLVALVALLAGNATAVPIRHVDVTASFGHVELAEVRERIAPHARAGFFAVDLAALVRDLEDLPWVRQASARRVWPDRLQLEIREHRAVARWQGNGLINAEGEIFAEATGSEALVDLHGPPGDAARVLEAYAACWPPLEKAGLRLDRLAVDRRGSWRAALAGGVSLRLGRRDPQAVLTRFIETGLPALRGQLDRIAYIDLRYTNGFAVAERGSGEGSGEG